AARPSTPGPATSSSGGGDDPGEGDGGSTTTCTTEMLIARTLRLYNVDRVIALKFPAYLIPHHDKRLWLLPPGGAPRPPGRPSSGRIRGRAGAGGRGRRGCRRIPCRPAPGAGGAPASRRRWPCLRGRGAA